jgi:DNA-binding LacI/PurR family transcriptional regulator
LKTTTKSQRVERYLRREIARGVWSPGQRLPDDWQIGNALDVSRATVNNVMSLLARDGLLERRKRAGTFLSDRVRVGQVAILVKVQDLTSPAARAIQFSIEEMQRLVRASGLRPVLALGHGQTPEAFADSTHLFDEAVTRETLGVLATHDIGPLADRLRAQGVPVVTTHSQVGPATPGAVLDLEAMVKMGVGLLVERGHRDFVAIWHDTEPDEESNRRNRAQRLAWFRNAMPDFPAERLVWVPFGQDLANAYGVFNDIWNAPNRPKAIFFCDDVIFDGASRAIRERRVCVPEELALLTLSTVQRPIPFPVPLVRLEFDVAEEAWHAWRMMEALIAEKTLSSHVTRIAPRLRDGRSLDMGGA